MFDDLRAAFREAVDNFNKELRRDQIPETVDKLLAGMRNEIADSKVQISDLEAQIRKALTQAESEKTGAVTCRRREEMARRIGDEETARLAVEYALKHEGRQQLLERKALTMQEELEFLREEVDGMMAKFKEAEQSRDALAATAGRSEARGSISAADDLFGELDRMAEKIEGERAQGEAAEAVDELDFDSPSGSEYRIDLDEAAPREELDVDAALEELKRRMGES